MRYALYVFGIHYVFIVYMLEKCFLSHMDETMFIENNYCAPKGGTKPLSTALSRYQSFRVCGVLTVFMVYE